jgi:hypothetical protein
MPSMNSDAIVSCQLLCSIIEVNSHLRKVVPEARFEFAFDS